MGWEMIVELGHGKLGIRNEELGMVDILRICRQDIFFAFWELCGES